MPRNNPVQRKSPIRLVGDQESSNNLVYPADFGNSGGGSLGGGGGDPVMADLRGRVARLEGGLVALGLMMLLAIGGLYLYLGNRLTPIEAKVSALEVDVAKIGGDIKLVDYRLARMEQRLDGIDQKLDAALSRNSVKR